MANRVSTVIMILLAAVGLFATDQIPIGGLFILTGGLVKTGVVDLVGRRLHRISGGDEFRLTALIMFTAAACASVMKNTTTTAMFVPVVLGLAERARVRFGDAHALFEPFSMFELTPVGIAVVVAGMAYMLLLGLRLLPARGGDS